MNYGENSNVKPTTSNTNAGNNNGMTTLFGPLNKQYCFYFYIISLFSLVALVLFVLSSIFIGVTQKKGGQYYLGVVSIAIIYGMGYLSNRLLFQMCSHSL
jgi:hypothetical protein